MYKKPSTYMKIKMQKLIKDIMYGRRKDAVTLPMRVVLRFLAAGYGVITGVRNFLYNRRILKALEVPCRVISVGNIIMGGTGKTPVTIMTASLLKEAGLSVAIVSRGYKRQGKSPLVGSDGSSVLVSSLEAGDEPHIAASSLADVPVVVGSNRYKAAMLAYERFKPKAEKSEKTSPFSIISRLNIYIITILCNIDFQIFQYFLCPVTTVCVYFTDNFNFYFTVIICCYLD